MHARRLVQAVWRRRDWLFRGLDTKKVLNMATVGKDFVLKHETTKAVPAIVKIDISPVCNLRCTACVHASPEGNDTLESQVFKADHRMSIEQYTKIVNEVAGKATAVSLYYLGDPLTHPDFTQMCRIASDAGLQVHASTNFSFGFKDEKIWEIVQSGLTHLTVCIDGLTQEKYERTRVGGRIDRVLTNLERVCKFREQMGSKDPLIEVQYIKFKHNEDELEKAREMVEGFGVNQFVDFWGDLHNWTDRDPGKYETLRPKSNPTLPLCYWPFFSTVIKYNGDVIPCCTHRQGMQYDPGADDRNFGNVFESSLEEIWNSQQYQEARRLVSHPEKSETEPGLKKHFCDECPVIFETDRSKTGVWADDHDYEKVFELDDRNKPHRKNEAEEKVAAG